MVNIKTLYYDVAKAVDGICDRTYYQSRPVSIDERVNSYVVIVFPAGIRNNEMDPSGSYNDYTATLFLEVYVRDRMRRGNPEGMDMRLMGEKVSAALDVFPIDTANIFVSQAEVVLQDNDGSGFHMTLIRARLRTK